MKLLVDIGHSRIKWALVQTNKWIKQGSCALSNQNMQEQWQSLAHPEQIAVANVAGTMIEQTINLLCQRLWSLSPNYLKSQAQQCGITNAYKNPEQLGIDRWLAMIAAYKNNPICVIDTGSAITVDFVDASGLHTGGWITPGITMMQNQLHELIHPQKNTDTASAIQQGCHQQAIAYLNDCITHAKTKLGEGVACYLTGGDAAMLQDKLTQPIIYNADLVLKGLNKVTQ